jgi:hypothetical protein
MAPIIEQKGIFQSIDDGVIIPQKTVDYTPSDKLVLVILSQLCGHQTLSEVNWTLRVDEPLLLAFGYEIGAASDVERGNGRECVPTVIGRQFAVCPTRLVFSPFSAVTGHRVGYH